MRVSAIGFIANTIDETIDLSRKVTEVTHNHPEGIKGAEATSVSIFLAKMVIRLMKLEIILINIIISWISN